MQMAAVLESNFPATLSSNVQILLSTSDGTTDFDSINTKENLLGVTNLKLQMECKCSE